VQRRRGVAGGQSLLQHGKLVQQQLEPELVHLVHDDEHHLVRLAGAGPLCPQDLLQREVGVILRHGGLVGYHGFVGDHDFVTSPEIAHRRLHDERGTGVFVT